MSTLRESARRGVLVRVLEARGSFGEMVQWASTETSPVAPGHIEGALAAAERTVANLFARHHRPHQETTP